MRSFKEILDEVVDEAIASGGLVEMQNNFSQPKTTTDKVIKRLQQRAIIGLETYGKPLMPHNGRWQLKDLMEEILDAACYLQNEIDEQDVEPNELW
jgi:hypothetical protein